jgi:TonB-dependent receptor
MTSHLSALISSRTRAFATGWLCFLALAFAPAGLRAQPGTGSIAGAVSNQSTRLFLDRAEIKIDGTSRTFLTDRDGTYALTGLAAGTYDLVVSYTGLDTEKRRVTVSADTKAAQDFTLTSGIYKLGAFTVAAEAEGNAAAINQQKKSDVFIQAISTDTLGIVPDGNIGEFLRYVPGLQVNFSNADASTVSMRGQDPESTLFTFDGQIPAAAGTPPRSSTGSSDASSRAFEFSSATISNIETIEVFKAPPPWMAPSTGGVINAVTKNAFQQRGRRFSTTFTLSANSEMLRLGEVPGPGARPTSRLKPGGGLNYSEAFLNNTLGLTFSYFESNVINPQHNYAMGYSPFVAGTVANPVTENSRYNVNTFTLVDGPQVKNRRTFSLGGDYKLGQNTVLKLKTSYNGFVNQSRSHTFRVKPGVIDPASTTTDVTLRNTGVDVFDDYSDQIGVSYGYVGSIEHKIGAWKLDGSASYSKSDSKVTDLPSMIQSVQFNLVAAQGVTVRMTASPDTPAPLTLTQSAGPDLYDLRSYTNTTGLSLQTSPRFQNDRTWNLKFDVKRNLASLRFPFEFRSGASLYQLHRKKQAGQIVLNFLGPDGITGTADDGPNALNASLFDGADTYGDKFLYGIRKPPLLDPYKVADYMQKYPLAIQDTAAANIARRFTNSQSMAQDITAVYVAGTVKVGSRLTLTGGVRGEQTENFLRGLFRQNSLGTGLTGLDQQLALYSQTQRVTSDYVDYFPNLQTVYRFSPDLLFRAALTRSMSRPGVQSILPATTVNDLTTPRTVSVNNAALSPTYARNLDLHLELYTRPAGSVTLGWFRKTITNYIVNDRDAIVGGSAEDAYDNAYGDYDLISQANGGKGQFEGFEASARQGLAAYLKFLPEVARGWDVFGSYSRNTKGEAPNRAGVLTKPLAPNFYDWNASWGVTYTFPRQLFSINLRNTIFPEAITTAASTTNLLPTFESSHSRWDGSVKLNLSRTYAVELTGSNLTNDSWRNFYQGGRNTSRRTFGTQYSLSFRANLDQLRIPFLDRK